MKKYEKHYPVILLVIITAAVFYLGFTKRGKAQVSKATNLIKPKSMVQKWHSHQAPEQSKDIWFNGTTYHAQVKNINGKDYALLPDNSLVVWADYNVYVNGKVISGGIMPSEWKIFTEKTF